MIVSQQSLPFFRYSHLSTCHIFKMAVAHTVICFHSFIGKQIIRAVLKKYIIRSFSGTIINHFIYLYCYHLTGIIKMNPKLCIIQYFSGKIINICMFLWHLVLTGRVRIVAITLIPSFSILKIKRGLFAASR